MRISRGCFANFVANFRTTFVRVSRECRENFHVSRTSRELVASVLNMFKNFMRIFFAKIFRKTVARDTRTNAVRVSYDGRATVLRNHANTSRLSGEKIKQSDVRTNVVRNSHECSATENENTLHSWGKS